jgi:catechol 2,3-dioxygenase-like lactoylglutathione lyase family enzyme
MKRLHVHVSVKNLSQSIEFYRTLFAAEPTIIRPDYAKWMLDDPHLNFAISQRGGAGGIEHLGIQTETAAALHEVAARLEQAGRVVLKEGATTCCYAESEKSWITDPQGLAWETFLTTGHSTGYGRDLALEAIHTKACCTPETPQNGCCAPQPERPAADPCCGS